MGLDWMVEAKVLPTKEREHQVATRLFRAAEAERDRREEDYFEKRGVAHTEEDARRRFEDFQNTCEGAAFIRTVNECYATLQGLEVSAASTLGAPVVGRDEKADAWVKENWKSLRQFSSETEALTKLKGDSVFEPKLLTAESRKGLGTIRGIAAGVTSFRGKELGFIDWLPEHLVDEAYTDHTSEQLADYGARLMEIVKRSPEIIRAAGRDPHEEQQNRELITLKAAANWCLFWGVRGHGMRAWY